MKHKREEEQKFERTLDHEADLTLPKEKVMEVLSCKSPTPKHISEIFTGRGHFQAKLHVGQEMSWSLIQESSRIPRWIGRSLLCSLARNGSGEAWNLVFTGAAEAASGLSLQQVHIEGNLNAFPMATTSITYTTQIHTCPLVSIQHRYNCPLMFKEQLPPWCHSLSHKRKLVKTE